MESKVDYLERTVESTDRKLEDLTWKVEKWERAVSQVSLFEETSPQLESEQEDCVLHLLQDVTQVKEDYEQLRSDITEIQQLQKELSHSLRAQLHNMHAKYGFLRSKLGPALPSCLMMSTNSYQGSPTKHADIGKCEQKDDYLFKGHEGSEMNAKDSTKREKKPRRQHVKKAVS